MIRFLRPDTQPRLILAASLFMVAFCNRRFFSAAADAFPLQDNVLFLLSLGIVLCGVLCLLFLLVSSRWTLKPMLLVFLLIAGFTSYAADNLKTVIDTGMLVNILQTDPAEVVELLTPELSLRLAILVLLPAFVIIRLPLRRRSCAVEMRGKAMLAGAAVLVIAANIALFGTHYASFFREYKPVRFYTNPAYPVYSMVRLWSDSYSHASPRPWRHIYADAALPPDDDRHELMILVVGETARADHFGIYGYSRPTTPVLASQGNIFVFEDASSCGTATAVSVPGMFAESGRNDFDAAAAAHEDNVLDVLQRAGVNVLWRDNNSGSKGVADRVSFEDFRSPDINPDCDDECRDAGMLFGLDEYITRHPGDALIVLHQKGSHGPAYYKRYPASESVFQPVCATNRLSDCSHEEIVNAYDNTIRYTDKFLGQVIALLQRYEADYEVAMLYVSDHGESLGENGVYLHGLPYPIAPQAQTKVPLLMWLGTHNDVDKLSLSQRVLQAVTHDALFPTLLQYFEIDSEIAAKSESLIHSDDS